jgi:hypothetical protein
MLCLAARHFKFGTRAVAVAWIHRGCRGGNGQGRDPAGRAKAERKGGLAPGELGSGVPGRTGGGQVEMLLAVLFI